MWTTVVLLGLAVSIEPARVALIALLLSRPSPIRHLITFLCTGLIISFSFGAAVLFIFHHSFSTVAEFNMAAIQLGIGVIAVIFAAVLASNLPLHRYLRRPPAGAPITTGEKSATDNPAIPQTSQTRIQKCSQRIRTFLGGDSSWLSGSIGAAMAMPSVDYMALLALIIASKTSPLTQAWALLTFLALASAAAIIPLFGFLLAPAETRRKVQFFNAWIRSRTRRHAAAFIGAIGTVLIVIGLTGL